MSEDAIERKRRFVKFASAANFDPEDPANGPAREFLKNKERDPAFRRYAKQQAMRCAHLNHAFMLNGPSLYADQYLRRFLLEYNNRTFKGGGNEQPTSFNILRAFVTPDETAFVLKLLEEKFFQFNIFDYLDFITGEAGSSSIDLRDFEELTIYELNAAGAFAKIQLPDLDELVFCGAALVRERNEISIVAVLGNPKSQFIMPEQIDPESIRPSKKQFMPDGAWDLSAEPLFDNEQYYPLLVMARIDTDKWRVHARYILHESKDSFRVTTDDPDVMLEPAWMKGDHQETIRATLKELSRYEHVFEFVYHLLQFPNFARLYEDDFYVERHPTKLKLSPPTTRIRKMRESLEAKYCPNYRDVLTLPQRSPSDRKANLDPSGFRFETSGYWKTLPLGKLGADKNSNVLHGKTWVQKDLSWREIDKFDEASRTDKTIVTSVAATEEVGFIYIMRSPVHDRNLYKIGFTMRDPEERANDLSSTSGQPDALVVMQSWKVIAPRRVEQQVHRELANLRINSRREFFKAKYEILRGAVERVISELHAEST